MVLNGNENPNDNSIEQVIDAGQFSNYNGKIRMSTIVLSIFRKETIEGLLPIITDDIKGRVDGQTVYNEVYEFLYLFQVFSHRSGLSKEDRADVLDAKLTIDALEKQGFTCPS